MNSYNLYSPNDANIPLVYPFYSKWKNSEVHICTHPDRKIEVGDEIFIASEFKDGNGLVAYSYIYKRVIVKSILFERKAKGIHKTDFTPIYQKISI